ncbi:MAG TPA: tRNA (adenosine(37)-N6)-threonylcarbamoyltransferase complex transferase subunit TsaD [Terriglobia bacterium]|jgi:N6-L-threonylcarbamoyladenine synthase|nr:tRNA (adenosine(37)-N6)-threonylcarbamoyltransferase complex transferase subunit TsaD [Terriglobia bacterium]
MLVLGIESSCDETAAAVVADGERILSNVVASQILTHERFGGVVPELASREHLRRIGPVVGEACARAGVTPATVDALAVTEGPGLIGSLLVGLVYAKALAAGLGKPLVGVNHLEGHIHAVLLENKLARAADPQTEAAEFPNVTLVVSGGHTVLYRVEADDPSGDAGPRFRYSRLGQTRDDAAGEAFDKVAKLLALGYPGGPVIDRLAARGDADAVDFGRVRMKGNPLDFSFSGLKTAVLYRVRGSPLEREAEERRRWQNDQRREARHPGADELGEHCSRATLDLIASFQTAVVNDLVERTLAAAEAEAVSSVFVSGGVACNSFLRRRAAEAARAQGFGCFFPSLALATDNAAMIAAAGYFKLAAGERADVTLTAHASFPLGVKPDGTGINAPDRTA